MTEILTGHRVCLRAPGPADAEAVLAWVNDADFRRHLNLRYPLSPAQEVAWADGGGAAGRRVDLHHYGLLPDELVRSTAD